MRKHAGGWPSTKEASRVQRRYAESCIALPDWWEDVLSTYLHISDDSVDAADAYLDAIEALLDRLLEFPELGTLVPLAASSVD